MRNGTLAVRRKVLGIGPANCLVLEEQGQRGEERDNKRKTERERGGEKGLQRKSSIRLRTRSTSSLGQTAPNEPLQSSDKCFLSIYISDVPPTQHHCRDPQKFSGFHHKFITYSKHRYCKRSHIAVG